MGIDRKRGDPLNYSKILLLSDRYGEKNERNCENSSSISNTSAGDDGRDEPPGGSRYLLCRILK